VPSNGRQRAVASAEKVGGVRMRSAACRRQRMRRWRYSTAIGAAGVCRVAGMRQRTRRNSVGGSALRQRAV